MPSFSPINTRTIPSSSIPLSLVGSVGNSLTRGMVSFWNLGESSGTTRRDSYGNNHLSSVNTVGPAVGKVGGAAQFNRASNRYLTIANNSALTMGDIDFTISAWLYFDTKANDQVPLSKFDTSLTSREFRIFYGTAADRLSFTVSNNGTATASATANNLGTVPTATWLFVIIWHDSVLNTINIQVNNGSVDSTSHSLGVFSGTSAFNLGTQLVPTPTASFDGRLDAVGVWKRLLTIDERRFLYNSGTGREYPLR